MWFCPREMRTCFVWHGPKIRAPRAHNTDAHCTQIDPSKIAAQLSGHQTQPSNDHRPLTAASSCPTSFAKWVFPRSQLKHERKSFFFTRKTCQSKWMHWDTTDSHNSKDCFSNGRPCFVYERLAIECIANEASIRQTIHSIFEDGSSSKQCQRGPKLRSLDSLFASIVSIDSSASDPMESLNVILQGDFFANGPSSSMKK